MSLDLGVVTLGLHLMSRHVPAEEGLNEINPGIYAKAENGLTLGIYKNSLRKKTLYFGETFEQGGFGLTVGLMHAERPACDYQGRRFIEHNPSWRGFGIISYRFSFVRLSLLPPSGQIPAVVHLSIEREFR